MNARPLISNGRAIIGDDKGSIISVDAKTGETIWTVNSAKKLGFRSEIKVNNGVLFAYGNDGMLYALDEKSVALPPDAAGGNRFGTDDAKHSDVCIVSEQGQHVIYKMGMDNKDILMQIHFIFRIGPSHRFVIACSHAGGALDRNQFDIITIRHRQRPYISC